MIIQALVDYYTQLERAPAEPGSTPLAPFGYSVQKVSFAVVLNEDGSLHAIEDARDEEPAEGKKTKPRRVPRPLVVPAVPGRTVAVAPGFLCDTAVYVLGQEPPAKPGQKPAKPERIRACFEAFRDRHLTARDRIDDDGFRAVCCFLEGWDPKRGADYPVLAEIAGGFGVFQIRGREGYVHESAAVREHWEAQDALSDPEDESGDGDHAPVHAPSLTSGRVERLARLHEPAIKGVQGAQTSGAKLASFNCAAFESYGKSQTYNAPVGVRDAFRYCTALNRLLSEDRHRVRLGDVTVVFWTEKPAAVELFGRMIGGNSMEDVAARHRLIEALHRAREGLPTELGNPATPFYVLGLSPNVSRLSVRFWFRSTVGEVFARLRDRQRQLELAGPSGSCPLLTVRTLVNATARVKKTGETDYDTIAPNFTVTVFKALSEGQRLPASLLLRLVQRITADGFVTHSRLAAIKLCLLDEGRITMDAYLNKVHPEPAYHCGRLFATIAFAQEQAIGEVKVGVVRRGLGGVLAAPGLTLPRIEKTAEMAYYPKIEGAIGSFVRDQVRDIHGALGDSYPKTLDAWAQGVFLLGFYQQDHWLASRAGLFKGKTPPRRTARGDWVRSRGEIRVADCLLGMGINYVYEPRKVLASGPERWPDFYVQGASPRDDLYIEYLGMVQNAEYDDCWRQKSVAYHETGISEAGGPNGRLVILDARMGPLDDIVVRRALRGLVTETEPNTANS